MLAVLASFVVAWNCLHGPPGLIFAPAVPATREPPPAVQPAPEAVDGDAPALVWDAAPPCPDGSFVRARIEALIGRPLADGSEAVHAVAVVDLGPPRPRVHLRVRSETGVRDRTIEDDDCAALAEITAVVVAIAIDPSASLRQPEDVAPPPAPKPAPKPVPAAKPVAPPEPKLQGLVRAAAGVGWGAVPGIAPTLGLVAGLRWRHARLELGAEHWFMQQARFQGATSVGVDVRLTAVTLHGCWVPSLGIGANAPPKVKRLEFPLCAGAAVGSLRGDGVGVPRGTTTRLVWSAGHVAAALLFAPIRALAFGLDARLVVPFSRNEFTLDDYGVAYRTSVAGVLVSAVIEGRFP